MYTLNRLDNALAASVYEPFTFPLFRPRLQALKPQGFTVAIAISDSSKPIGLALAEMRPESKSAEVLSIFVEPLNRHRGIGTALLMRLEQELLWQGCTNVKLVYTSGRPTTSALERLLQKCNWASPQPRMLVCKSTMNIIANAPWMQRGALPASYSIFPWVEVTAQERISIKQQQEASPWIPQDLIPFQYEENLEPLNSIGLRYQGQVVGWVITHRLIPDTIRYTCSFVRQDLQKMGRIIPLYVSAIQTQAKANILKGSWTVPLVHSSMVHFVKKRMAPYLTSLKTTKESSKSLIEDGSK